ncbi:hypothetical protein [Bacillus bombysepticus]|uniref:hypothetical protein n=1 Tax=Bacillus bombysepticus TaxID=658666 RepID=UPI00301AA5CE
MYNHPIETVIGKRNHDGLFKELICNFFKEYIQFTQEHVVDMLDFTHVKDRNNHVSGLQPYKEKGTDYYADAVIETQRTNGEKVIFHIEAQSYSQDEFPKRMYEYNAMCRIKYKCDVVSQALCFNENQNNIPSSITYTDFTTGKVSTEFNYGKIDLNSYDITKYEDTDNPFVLAVLGLMKGYNSKKTDKVELKLKSYIKLFDMKLPDDKHLIIATFLEMYMGLNDEDYHKFIKRLKEEEARRDGLERWVMGAAENNEFVRITVEKKATALQKDFLNTLIDVYIEQYASNPRLLKKAISATHLAEKAKTSVELAEQVLQERKETKNKNKIQ